ncbi:MAG: UPF0182 family protein [Candidatus Wallbacteria bacterium HGW-Wallbacteria-1]|jgi:hypothetical protein|uniref:UPF0182 protein CVV64_15390 n=1 Tax=Candidatus Wallbacteria bacterium HGW-Wallbacteria-1 TaxID=2013854 RepID=A0A2N1PLH5_9BACT|nr:MAG: UPF0182 family protein [Candidatus Wallbacteria bacterium HGW-Wallbacteria-1]
MDYSLILKRVIAILGLVFFFQSMGQLAALYPDLLWFESLGMDSVLWTTVLAKILCCGSFGLLFTMIFGTNLLIAVNGVSREGIPTINSDGTVTAESRFGGTPLKWIMAAVAVIFGYMVGSGLVNEWEKWLLFFNSVPANIADPVFGRDLSFYMFTLPFIKLFKTLFDSSVFISIVGVIWIYAVNHEIDITPGNVGLSGRTRRHFGVLAAVVMVSFAAGRIIDGWELLYSSQGVAFGASYTDVHASLPGLRITALTALAAAGAFLTVFRGSKLNNGIIAVVVLMVVNFLGTDLYPAFVQKFTVKPNEITLEKTFIQQDISNTRTAYGLSNIIEKSFEVGDLAPGYMEQSPETISNIRLWDEAPLMKTYKQLQEMRLYYDFESTFTDRYNLGGIQTQVVLSPRELNFRNVPDEAKTWVNEHIQYTHGHGICMSPVNSVTQDGLPRLLVKDIPPNSTVDEFKDLVRPEIYFGQLTDSWVVVDTTQDEFDYPLGGGNQYCRYSGKDGVEMGSFFRKLLFSVHFRDIQIMTTNYLTGSSKILFDRNIQDRVEKIAPFLFYDGMPYMVAADMDGRGKRLFWILEAYTISDRYPYSRPRYVKSARGVARLNYIRNSVKVVVDAYDGQVNFYSMDARDPILGAWSRVYPGLFRPASELPPSLSPHLRYPKFLFEMQADIYKTYHMTRAEVFYNQEDKWNFPRRRGGSDEEFATMASYLTFRLPDEKRAEFLLTVPFTPVKKDNMVAFLVGRCDGDSYGKLVSYSFPKKKLVYGPMQIEARIDQQPEISKLMTLWGQKGSQVIRGEVTVIPVMGSLLYVQPIYLRAARGELPQLTSVVVADGERIAMASRLDEAIERLMNSVRRDSRQVEIDVAKLAEKAGMGVNNETAENTDNTGNVGNVGNGGNTEQSVLSGGGFDSGSAGDSISGMNSGSSLRDFASRASRLLDEAGKAASRGEWDVYGQRMGELKVILDRAAQ